MTIQSKFDRNSEPAQAKRTLIGPKFGQEFKCIGEECSLSCCKGWTVSLDKDTYRLYKSTPGIAEHVQKPASTQHRSGKSYGNIKMRSNGSCPLLTETGLCKVQQTLGEASLSETCTTFPRGIVKTPSQTAISYTNACPEVARLCMDSADSMQLERSDDTLGQKLNYGIQTSPDMTRDGSALFGAVYNFISLSDRALWKDILVVISYLSSIKSAPDATQNEITQQLFAFGEQLKQDTIPTDPSIFQVTMIYPTLLQTVHLGESAQEFTEVQQTANLALGGAHVPFEQKVKNFVIARETYWKLFCEQKPYALKNLFLNDLLRIRSLFSAEPELIVDRILDQVLNLAMIRFIQILTFQAKNTVDVTAAAHVAATISRKLSHSERNREQLKKALEHHMGDVRSVATLLLA